MGDLCAAARRARRPFSPCAAPRSGSSAAARTSRARGRARRVAGSPVSRRWTRSCCDVATNGNDGGSRRAHRAGAGGGAGGAKVDPETRAEQQAELDHVTRLALRGCDDGARTESPVPALGWIAAEPHALALFAHPFLHAGGPAPGAGAALALARRARARATCSAAPLFAVLCLAASWRRRRARARRSRLGARRWSARRGSPRAPGRVRCPLHARRHPLRVRVLRARTHRQRHVRRAGVGSRCRSGSRAQRPHRTSRSATPRSTRASRSRPSLAGSLLPAPFAARARRRCASRSGGPRRRVAAAQRGRSSTRACAARSTRSRAARTTRASHSRRAVLRERPDDPDALLAIWNAHARGRSRGRGRRARRSG